MWPFKKKEEVRTETTSTVEEATTLEDLLLQAGLIEDVITRDQAMNIPAVAGCVELICNTIATLPIKLFQEIDDNVQEIKDDVRTKLLNDDTKDTLDAFQCRKALIEDYLLAGEGYIYINKVKGSTASLHYVKENNVSINMNTDPIFKDYDILVNGNTYRPYDFIKLLRNTKNGADGTGIVAQNQEILAAAYNSLLYENILAKTGGNKKGFIKAEGKLGEDEKNSLKTQWNNMYSRNSENCVVLNKGLSFQESNATSTEMQLNENKVTNGDEICKIFNVPPSMISGDGKANESDYEKYVKMSILPIIKAIVTALNRDLLLEKEKGSFYFVFDIKELMKGDLLKRYQAYEIAIKNKILEVNEVRYEEDKPPIAALNDTLILGLEDVLYNTETGNIYTPNTDKTTNMKGGDVKNANRNTQ